MSLLNRYEEIKKGQEKIDNLESKIGLRGEIADLVSDILNGKERYYSKSVVVFKKFNIKYKKEKQYLYFDGYTTEYSCKITKTLIKKIEKYLESENEDE